MGTETKIGWTDKTGGPFLGCTEVSAGCDNCYARELMLRRLKGIVRPAYQKADLFDWETRDVWGKTAPRVLTKGFWTQALAANKSAEKAGTNVKWFPSMIDWLDNMPAGIVDQDGNWLNGAEVMVKFFQLIRSTPNITWQLLTKRPASWRKRIEDITVAAIATGDLDTASMLHDWVEGQPPQNVWIGVTVENQEQADKRIPCLVDIPATIRFLSCEPLIGPVNLSMRTDWMEMVPGIHWVICGGESGPKARPMDLEWARSLRDQCSAAGVAFYFKQWGEWCPVDGASKRVGTKAAGNQLDGKFHRDFPLDPDVPNDRKPPSTPVPRGKTLYSDTL